MHKKSIVFIGDSITEAGKFEDPEQIGSGYVRVIHDYLRTTYPVGKMEIVNKGIGGDRITDLAQRWQADVIDLQPEIVSISVGINDVWRQLDNPGMVQVYPDEFERIYDDLLKQVREDTNAQIILMEPTIIEENLNSVGNKKLIKYVEIVNLLAEKYEAVLVSTHQAFTKYVEANNGYQVTTDGVHMNSAGNMLMATCWLELTKGIR